MVCVSCIPNSLNHISDRGSTSDPCLVVFILAQCIFEDLLCFCKDVCQDIITALKVSFACTPDGEAGELYEVIAVPPLKTLELVWAT